MVLRCTPCERLATEALKSNCNRAEGMRIWHPITSRPCLFILDNILDINLTNQWSALFCIRCHDGHGIGFGTQRVLSTIHSNRVNQTRTGKDLGATCCLQLKITVENHGCTIVDLDIDNDIINLDGPDEAVHACARAIADLAEP